MKAKITFTSTKNPFSWLIRKVQKFNSSHALILFDKIGVESALTGVVCKSYDNILHGKEVVHSIPVELNQESLLYAQSKMGCKYGYKAMLGFAIQAIFNLKRNPFRDKEESFVCSEFVARVLNESGFEFTQDFDTINVKDLYLTLNKQV